MHRSIMVLLPRPPESRSDFDTLLEALLDPFNENKYLTERVHDPEYPDEDYHRNPDGQWDWWMLGGRYAGKLCVLPTSESFERCIRYDSDYPLKSGTAEDTRSPFAMDCARWGDIDWGLCKAQAGYQAMERWQLAAASPEHARSLYGVPEGVSVEDYTIKALMDYELQTFGMLAEGKWVERPWDESSDGTGRYRAMQRMMLANMPDDQWIAIVDCHQ